MSRAINKASRRGARRTSPTPTALVADRLKLRL
jgi:hypothetical protein